jgi:hypothetical protein
MKIEKGLIMKIIIPIEIEINKSKDPNGDIIYDGSWGNFMDDTYKQLGCRGYGIEWIVTNIATRLADTLTPARLTYEITKQLKDGDVE